jgi:serine/threonine-protein kinase
MLGEVAARYRIVDRLGTGGMGEVYLAEDLRLRLQVALKMLPPSRGDDAARARLLREARVASSLAHPNIAVIYEIDEVEGPAGRTSFVAMEYVPGRTLGQLARGRSLSAAEIVALVRQVAEGLAEAHDRGVIHRDVKSSNVMVTDSGRVKVLDFGLAKYTPPVGEAASTWSRKGEGRSGPGVIVGTVAYMSPEQALGRELDLRTDIFSLGVVLYELLTGELPFPGSNAIEVIDAILHSEPPPLTLSGESLAPELQRIVRKMLAKDPAGRYQTMRELGRDFDVLERHPNRVASAAPPAENAVAVMTFTNITRDREDDWLGTGIAETVTADLKRVEGLTVVARERIWEVLRKLGGPAAVPDEALATRLGRELDARWVVGGGYQRLGEVVRVTARITDIETGALARTVKLDGRMGEIFALQDRIVGELSEGLRLDLGGAARGAQETHVVDAYEAFARGLLNLRLESYESLDRAVLFFERAVALDPRYARAQLQLGSAYDIKASYLGMPELHERALACFRRAIDLAPDLSLAWKEMGSCLTSLGREDEGIEAIVRALALDPADAAAHSALARAYFVGKARFADAADEYDTALRLNPQAGWSALQLSHCSALMRDFVRGDAAARRAAELQEQMQSGKDGVVIVGAYMRLGHLAGLQGRHPQALEFFERELAFLDGVDHALRDRTRIELHQRIGASHLRLGHAAEAQAAFAVAVAGFEERLRLGADEPFTRFYVAGVHALRGETELALAGLAKAAKMRRRFTVERARIEPEFDALRDDRRFQDLLARA